MPARPPRRDHYVAPATGPDTAKAIDAAIDTLGKARDLDRPRDDSATLHLLASLLVEAHTRLRRQVAHARDAGYSWAEIADLLGVTRASAWQRFGRTTNNQTNHPGSGPGGETT